MPFDATPGAASANSYVLVADADAYWALRPGDRATAWALLTTAQKEGALIQATDYIEAVYGGGARGARASSTQSLFWPRSWAYIDGYLLDDDLIPVQLKNATIELASRAAEGPLLEDEGQAVKREKVDVIEVEYMAGSMAGTRYSFVSRMLAPLFGGLIGGGNFQQARLLRV